MAKSLMIQGTMSNVGKSLLTAALCRIFWQDGHKVAPFKSQNMALNSYVTEDGLEMGRAQAVQAEACGLKPSVLMNPVLLKPNSDQGSQVIVNGLVYQNMPAADYFAYKKHLKQHIMAAYEELAAAHDIIVIEGAGSPAEINLKADDIVNMGLARMTHSPVLLVGDIDRGGVFAQLAGTLMLLEEEERQMVKGLIINKFRGDRSLLENGLQMIRDITRKDVWGVIPYLDLALEAEDSLSLQTQSKGGADLLDIAIIRLPHISNFTDFLPLDILPVFKLRYIDRPQQLGAADLLILPGTKNTLDDLCWLKETGLAQAIIETAERGLPILGICGGYQMLGQEIYDAEYGKTNGQAQGLALLPVRTKMARVKHLGTCQAKLAVLGGALQDMSGAAISAYEIHMGESECLGGEAFAVLADGRQEGCQEANVYGTYLHGLFESAALRMALERSLQQRKGAQATLQEVEEYQLFKEQQFDLLASAVRSQLDMKKIYRILGAN